mmetsp:Transcript_8004/g.16092  ORF Transcript_8004/g.16092 Transcript_8004/m.16092 type:complete len:275 (+) Transcript_8004:1456-2280(+)
MVKAYGDVGKAAKKLLNDDFVSDAKVTMKTKTSNGVSFTVDSLRLEKENALLSEVSIKYNVYGNACTTKYGSTGKISMEAILDQLGVNGVKLTLNGTTGSSQGATAKIEYTHPHLALTTLVDLIRGPVVTSSLVLGVHGVALGGEAEYDTTKAEVSKYAAVISKSEKDSEFTLWASDKFRKIKASYTHDVSAVTSVAAELNYDTSSEARSMAMGMKHALDSQSTVKARLESSGLLSLAYITDIRPGTKVVLATKMNTKTMDSAPSLGFHLTYEG